VTNKEIYSGRPDLWPRWLDEAEQGRLLEAAKSGAEAKRDTLIIAAMMYLGLSAAEASKVCFCTACGDAIEDRKRGAFLHIPNDYRKIVAEMVEDGEIIRLKDRLIDCTQKDAENAVKQVFQRAGMAVEYCFMRLKRTAAHLHYINNWTWCGDIERWFYEIGFIKSCNKALYYMGADMLEFSIVGAEDREE